MVTAQQQRVIILAKLLARGKPVKASAIHRALEPCSSATLTRTLNTLRHSYGAVIVYHRANHSYEMTDRGTLNEAALHALQYGLDMSKKAKSNGVSLRRDQRVRVSLSLPRSLVRALNQAARSEQKNRSQWVEQLIRSALVPQSEKKTVQLEAKTSSSSSKTPTNESP